MRDFDWKIIVTLHRTHNITKTADLLFISQPTLTKRIQTIEEELGIPLIIRSRKGSEFTPEGERLAKQAEGIVTAIDAVMEEAEARSKGKRGILRIGVPYSYTRYVLPALLNKYSKCYPDVEADVVTALSDELIHAVEDNTLDVCFAHYSAEESILERIMVSEDQMYAISSKPFQLEELPSLPQIQFRMNPSTVAAIRRWWDEHFSSPPQIRFRVPNGDVCITMVQNGLGYGIFSDPKYFQYEPNLYSMPLDFLDGTKFLRKTWLFYRREGKSRPIVTNFIDFVKQIDINHLN